MNNTLKPLQFLNRDIIKYIAIFAMLMNHIAAAFLEATQPDTLLTKVLTGIGSFTAITMIFFLVEGYHYTHSKKNYFTRLFIFALVSQIPFMMAFAPHGFMKFEDFNMIFTLCLCFGLLVVYDKVKNKFIQVCFFVIAFMISFKCDWAMFAPIFVTLFAWASNSESRKKIAFLISLFIFGAITFLSRREGLALAPTLIDTFIELSGMIAASVCILFLYNGKRMEAGRTFSKWFFYIFYPGHLIILGLIRYFLIG